MRTEKKRLRQERKWIYKREQGKDARGGGRQNKQRRKGKGGNIETAEVRKGEVEGGERKYIRNEYMGKKERVRMRKVRRE